MHVSLPAAGAALVVAIASSTAVAEPVQYVFDATGSGDLAGTSFTDATFQLVVTADTDDIFNSTSNAIRVVALQSTIDIAGFAPVDFSISTSVARNDSTDSIVFADNDADLALFIVSDAAFDGYDLTAPFGPVFDPVASVFSAFTSVPTTGGSLSFSAIRDVNFTAIPTPGTGACLALAGLAAARRRRA